MGDFLYNIGVRTCFLNMTQNPNAMKEKSGNLNHIKIKYICMGNKKKIMTRPNTTERKHLNCISLLKGQSS